MNIDNETNQVFLTAYRCCSGTYKGEWHVALDPREADETLAHMNKDDTKEWTLETHQIGMWIQDAKRLGAALSGSSKTLKKQTAARENGKKGGRPKGSKNHPNS